MNILNLLFRCRHKHLSWPFGNDEHGRYVTCTECGQKFSYDWKHMKTGKKLEEVRP